MVEAVSRVSSKGQVTIPVAVRRHLGVAPADKVAFALLEDGRVELRAARRSVASLRGSVPALPQSDADDFDRQIAEAFDARAERIAREIDGR